MAQMGDGSDTFVWNPGDGSDTVEGQGGSDRLVFNGSDESEHVNISANGNRVRLTRDVGSVSMDLSGVEDVNFNALGGADTMTVNDTSATDLSAVNLNLKSSTGSGDGQADSVIVNGTNGNDIIQILAPTSGARITVAGLFPTVNITGAEAANDHLTVNALGGNDVVDASKLPPNLIGLTTNGGVGNNLIVGSLNNGGFESPAVGNGFLYDPAGTPWAYTGSAGVAGNGSGFTAGNPNAPEGTQVGFLQGLGSFSQTLTGMAAGTYQLTFSAAQRANFQASRQDFQVLVDGVIVGTFTPSGTGYTSVTTDAFTLGAGVHRIVFQGLDSAGGDNTAFIDNVRLT